MFNALAPLQFIGNLEVPRFIQGVIQNAIPAIVVQYSLSSYTILNSINSLLPHKDVLRTTKVANFVFNKWLYGNRAMLCEDFKSFPVDFCIDTLSDVKGNVDLKNSKVIFLTNTEKKDQFALSVFLHDKTQHGDYYLDYTKPFEVDGYFRSDFSFINPYTETCDVYHLNTNGINIFKHPTNHPIMQKIKKIYDTSKHETSLPEASGKFSIEALVEGSRFIEEYQLNAIKSTMKKLKDSQRLFACVPPYLLTEQFLEKFKGQYTIVEFKPLIAP